MKTAIIIMGAIVLILFVLLVTYGMSEPRLTDEEAEQLRKQLNAMQDRDIELDGELNPGARYAIYENHMLVFSTKDFKKAQNAFETLCLQNHTEITMYEWGKVIGWRGVVSNNDKK